MSKYDKQTNSQKALDEARENDLEVVFPTPYELFLDFDTEEQFEYFNTMSNLLYAHFGPVLGMEWHASRSGLPHRHLTITLGNEITPKDRILLQALFGSDPKRELLSYVLLVTNDPHPTLFLEEPKQKALPPAPEPAGLLSAGDAPFAL